MKLKELPLDKIQPNENQPRSIFNDESINELAQSIAENGLIQPIIVRKEGNIYRIVAGERRYRACKQISMKNIPCLITSYEDKELDTVAVIENIQREDLSVIEEAKAYKKLLDTYGYTQQELSVIVGKKQSTIANKLRLLKLDDEIQDALNAQTITERHARAMLHLEPEKQKEILKQVVDQDLTVKETEKLINKPPKRKPKPKAKMKKIMSRNTKIAVNTVHQAIDMISKMGTDITYEEDSNDEEYVITIHIKNN